VKRPTRLRIADRERQRGRRPATLAQRRYLHVLARQAHVEVPAVAWHDQADEAIERLKLYLRQPTLGRMG
jgi:hypothetical protein